MNTIRRICNVLRWLPLLWRDMQFDYAYLLQLLRFKLELMERFFRSGDTHVLSALETADQIAAAKAAIDRLLTDNYQPLECVDFYAKWGTPDFAEVFSAIDPQHSEFEIVYPGVQSAENQAQCDAEFRACIAAADEARQRDWVRLWETMMKSWEWWD